MTSCRSDYLHTLITFQGQESWMEVTGIALRTKPRWALAKSSVKSDLVIMAHPRRLSLQVASLTLGKSREAVLSNTLHAHCTHCYFANRTQDEHIHAIHSYTNTGITLAALTSSPGIFSEIQMHPATRSHSPHNAAHSPSFIIIMSMSTLGGGALKRCL